MDKLKILFLEPFYGGSHKDFADGLIKNSRHDIDLFTLPARYWKWRMRGAALHFAEQIKDPSGWDLLFTSDMMSLSDLKMLWGSKCPPSVVYFHENQLSYPLAEGEKMDFQFGFTDITTALAADSLLFNSYSHLNSFTGSMPGFIKKMPEYKPFWVVDRIKSKASVIYPGCNFPIERPLPARINTGGHTPVIVWNHRWEFDKCPEIFFGVLGEADRILKAEGIEVPFNLVLLGENFHAKPESFLAAKKYYGNRILQYGFCDDKSEYFSWLKKSDIAVSTSIQENFGISVVEAAWAGCHPLLPDRLSYPELVPNEHRDRILYSGRSDFLKKLAGLIRTASRGPLETFSEIYAKYNWELMAAKYDDYFREFI
ncbi:MAG: DUF3524 domain-containing protein [Spirochaetales bacterium]|nr:DUF3524 domain-containing protein [Spirochaetales bacterium]